MTKNWRDLPAGPELDRAVAVRLGWRVEPMHDGAGPRFNLFRPGGVRYSKRHRSETSAWANVPAYSTDIGTALGLPLKPIFYWRLEIAPGDNLAQIMQSRWVMWECRNAKTPPLAIVRAWLAMMEQEAQDD